MSLKALLVATLAILPYTPGTAKYAGDLIQLADGRAAVVQTDLAASELGSVLVEGQFDVLCATGTTFSDGEMVYWDISASLAIKATSAEAGDFPLGPSLGAKASGPVVVRVDLNAVPAYKVMTVATTTTLVAGDFGTLGLTLYCDTQAGAFQVNLPAAAGCKGKRITTIRAGTGTNAVTLDGNASETIDGSATHATQDAARDTLTIESDGSNWLLICSRIA